MPGQVGIMAQGDIEVLSPTDPPKRKASASIITANKRTKIQDSSATSTSKRKKTPQPSSRTISRAVSTEPEATAPSPAQFTKFTTKPSSKKKDVREKKLPCTFQGCDKAFTRPCRLEEHIRSHTGERPFKCSMDVESCTKSFLRDSHLKAHIKSCHEKEKSHRCSFLIPAGEGDNRGEFGFKRKASEPPDGDDVDRQRMCGARFSTNQHLKRHMESHSKTFPYICKDFPPCTAGFRKKGCLSRHIRCEHQGLPPWACTHPGIESPEKTCSAAFDTKGKLGNHIATAHSGLAKKRYICTICVTSGEEPTSAEATNLPEVKIEEGDAALLLNLSQQSFPIIQTRPASLADAATLKTQGILGFATHAELRSHIAQAHPPVCKTCGFMAKRPRELKIHIREVHERAVEGAQVWACEWEGCSQDFTRKNNLKVHTRAVHQGLRPFPCPHEGCTDRFGYKVAMEKHVASWHGPGAKQRKKKAQIKKKRRVKEMSLIEKLTGAGHDEIGRNIECLVAGCGWRFVRVHDLRVHLGAQKGHAFDEDQISELIASRDGLEEEEVSTEDDDSSESDWSVASDGDEYNDEGDEDKDDGDIEC